MSSLTNKKGRERSLFKMSGKGEKSVDRRSLERTGLIHPRTMRRMRRSKAYPFANIYRKVEGVCRQQYEKTARAVSLAR
jgi:hypothetical protein